MSKRKIDTEEEAGIKVPKGDLANTSGDVKENCTQAIGNAPFQLVCVASRDEPTGIVDDWFLQQAMQNSSAVSGIEWALWDEDDWCKPSSNGNGYNNRVVLVRSMWEGMDRRIGTTDQLMDFYNRASVICPSMANDYALLDWITHKKYLLELSRCGVPIIPTALIKSDCIQTSFNGNSTVKLNTHVVSDKITPWLIKGLLEEYGWADAILKPAVGTRGEGVLKLQLSSWDLSMAADVQNLLSGGDCLLQPFMRTVRCTPNNGITVMSSSDHGPTYLWGEICIIFVNGIIVNAIHKNPAIWGWHRPHCACSAVGSALRGAECHCDGRDAAVTSSDTACFATIITNEASDRSRPVPPSEVSAKLEQAHVESLALPLPASIMEPATAALKALPGFDDKNCPLLCRVDLLPRVRRISTVDNADLVRKNIELKSDTLDIASGGAVEVTAGKLYIAGERDSEEVVEWLVSEVEGQWCECFLRAAPAHALVSLIEALKIRA